MGARIFRQRLQSDLSAKALTLRMTAGTPPSSRCTRTATPARSCSPPQSTRRRTAAAASACASASHTTPPFVERTSGAPLVDGLH